MSNNIQRLGETLAKRMLKTANAAVMIEVEFATFNENQTITPDSLRAQIPKGEYQISAGQKPKAGDRVLIAWAGNDPVIIGAASTEPQPTSITVTSDGEGHVTITL